MKIDVEGRVLDAAKALVEPMRWRIVQLLGTEELCVCHLVEELAAPQPLVSHHLKVLRDVGLVETERFRYWTYYRLRREAVAEVGRTVLDLAEAAPVVGDRRRPCC